MILIKNTQRKIFVDVDKLQSNAKTMLSILDYEDYDLGIWLTTNKTIRKFNKQYRHKDKATDILSFPYYELSPGEQPPDDEKNLGDIIISLEYVQKNAPSWGHSFEERMKVLLAHGIAHLLGYDHETDEEYSIMNKLETKLLKGI